MSTVRSGLAGYRSLVSVILSILLLFPLLSAYAESLTVTTNKDLYTEHEKAIIVGMIPEGAPTGYAVLLRVSGPDGTECVVQNVLPDSDNSFVSRPVEIADCGPGQYSVMAFYAELSANSTFTVSNSTKTESVSKLELRLLRNIAIQAQESVNKRLKEFLESSGVLPEDIADKYSIGVFEASLVLQAVDFGDTAEAKKHLIFSVKHFREVLDSLSSERVVFSDPASLAASSSPEDEDLQERYMRMKEFYFRLEEVAQKNNVKDEAEFGAIVSLLAMSKQFIDEGNFAEADRDLDEASTRLESIRQELYHSQPPASNSTSDLQARKLSGVADRFERNAYAILGRSEGASVNATVQEALQLIAQARIDIAGGDYDSARSNLSAAYMAIDQAKQMAEDEERDGNADKGSGKDDNENNSGKEKGDQNNDDNDHSGSSNTGSDEGQDQ